MATAKYDFTSKYVSEIFCSLQIEGIHYWANCPIEEVKYLRDPHRHVFHIKAYKAVSHTDRDTEFIWFKHEISQFLTKTFYNK